MKRPQSKPTTRNVAGLPSAPARISAKPAKPKKVAKPAKAAKKTKANSQRPITNKALKSESKRLLSIRKAGKEKNIFARLSPEARRFTQASRQRRLTFGIVASALGLGRRPCRAGFGGGSGPVARRGDHLGRYGTRAISGGHADECQSPACRRPCFGRDAGPEDRRAFDPDLFACAGSRSLPSAADAWLCRLRVNRIGDKMGAVPGAASGFGPFGTSHCRN